MILRGTTWELLGDCLDTADFVATPPLSIIFDILKHVRSIFKFDPNCICVLVYLHSWLPLCPHRKRQILEFNTKCSIIGFLEGSPLEDLEVICQSSP